MSQLPVCSKHNTTQLVLMPINLFKLAELKAEIKLHFQPPKLLI